MRTSIRRSLTSVSGTIVAAAALVVLPAVPAHAGTVTTNGGTLFYDGQLAHNNVTVEKIGSSYTITDTGGGVSMVSGDGTCTITSGSTVDVATCPGEGVVQVLVSGGSGSDRITIDSSVPVATVLSGGIGDDELTVQSDGLSDILDGGPDFDTLSSGSGDDILSGDTGQDDLDGGPGEDTLYGAAGTDVLTGGDGNDVLDPGLGLVDEVSGGGGRDTVDYVREASVSVSLDGVANDGELGEVDNVDATVEIINGGSADDTLTGTHGKQVLNGAAGDDALSGGADNDRLIGSYGNDVLDGGDGDDTFDGGVGADSLSGGAGLDSVSYAASDLDITVTLDDEADDGFASEGDNVRSDMEEIATGSGDDVLVGTGAANEFTTGAGSDTVTAGGGSDGVEAGPGRDSVNGGQGIDSLYGQGGPDTINSRDKSKDYVACGGSVDKVTRNKGDQLTVDCEKVS